MRHDVAREKLLDLAYGELSPAEAAEVEAHLRSCAACRAEADAIAETRSLMRGLPPEEPPGGEGILMAAARQAAERARPVRSPLLLWLRPAVGVAVVVAVAGISWKLIGAGVERTVETDARFAKEPPAVAQAPAPTATPAPAPTANSTAAAPGAGAAAGTGAESGTEGLAAHAPQPPPPPAKAARARLQVAEPEVQAEAKGKAEAEADAEKEAIVAALAKERRLAVARRKAAPAEAREETADRMAEVALAAEARRPAAPPAAAGGAAPAAAAPPPAASAPAAPPAARSVAAAEPAASGQSQTPLDAAEELVRSLRRGREAGELNEARRRPDPCPGGDVERVAWLDGWGKVRRLARTGPLPAGMGEGEVTRDQYYDAEGRLRLVHLSGTGPEGRFARRIVLDPRGRRLLEDPPGKGPWPEADLDIADPSTAFWAPQRCGK